MNQEGLVLVTLIGLNNFCLHVGMMENRTMRTIEYAVVLECEHCHRKRILYHESDFLTALHSARCTREMYDNDAPEITCWVVPTQSHQILLHYYTN